MAVVDFARSRALMAARRSQKVQGSGRRIVRYIVRTMVILAAIIVLVDVSQLTTFSASFLGLVYILFALSLIGFIADLYIEQQWAAYPDLPPLPQMMVSTAPPNLADYLAPSAAELIKAALELQQTLKWSSFSPDLAFFAALESSSNPLLQRAGVLIAPDDVAGLKQHLVAPTNSSQTVEQWFEWAAEACIHDNRPRIDAGDLLVALGDKNELMHKLLFQLEVDQKDLIEAATWWRRATDHIGEIPWYDRAGGPGIAQNWTSGYTNFLNQYATNLTREIEEGHKPRVFGRATELASLLQKLAKDQGHNVLLIGEPGSGKETLVRSVAETLLSGDAPAPLRYQQVLSVNVGVLLAGISDRGQIQERLLRVFVEANNAGNTILCIPDIHLLIGGGDRVGGVDATEVLLQALQAPSLRVIALTTPEEYQARIAANPTLAGAFDRLELAELDAAASLEVLEDSVPSIEATSKAYFIVPGLRRIIEIADRYVHDVPFPQKALNLLSEFGAAMQGNALQIVTPTVVDHLLSAKLQLPLASATGSEKDTLLHLEDDLHKTVVGQDEAITAIASALRRARAGLATGKRPIATFLFLGPTGVGKTESAKALARVYFGSEDRMVRLDMSEYQQDDGVARLIGQTNQDATKSGGYLADQIHDQPFSLILLDELEKAHPQVLNLFLQVLDDGRLTDSGGRTIDFTNTIIIATSNAGAELIRESIAKNEPQEVRRTALLNYLQSQGIYKPEFLNRFDGVVAFRPLEHAQITQITRLILADLAAKLQTEQQITLSFSDDLVEGLSHIGFDPQFGARPIRRVIQDKVENWLSNQLLAGTIARGAVVQITASMVGLNSAPTPGIVSGSSAQQA